MAKEIAVVMMNKTEAKAALDKINNHVGAVAALVKDFYDREGWRALGYKNWSDCAQKEFSHQRSRVYQLLDEARVREDLGHETPPLSGRAVRELKHVPPAERKAAVASAQAASGSATPTGKQVKEAVKKNPAWKQSGVSKKKKAKQESIADQAKDDEKLEKALKSIGETCGPACKKALKEGTVAMSKADIIKLSEQDDETMVGAEKLISVNRWPLKKALSFLTGMPTLDSKLEQLTWLAVASPSDEWEGVFGAFTVTVKVNRRKL